MIENLDNQVGQILELLEEFEIEEETLIMFSSDNGPHKEGGHDPKFWNSSGNLRGHKRDMHEGGIRAPMLARWTGTIKPSSKTDHISCFQDLLPTIAELTSQKVPSQADGLSFLPTLVGNPSKQDKHEYLYWEFCKGEKQQIYSQAVRMGEWKAYLQKGKKLELFNLAKDPFEKDNVAEANESVVLRMKEILVTAHHPLESQKQTKKQTKKQPAAKTPKKRAPAKSK